MQQAIVEREFLTLREMQEMLALSRTKCWELVASGQVPAIKVGRSVRVHRRGLEEWIIKHGYTENSELLRLVKGEDE